MSESRFQQRRLRSSYLTSVVSITMVLFMLGLMGLLLINARKLTDFTRESFTVTVFFRDSVDEDQMNSFRKSLEAEQFVKSVQFTSKDQAAADFQKELGEDFVDFLGYNPLPASLDVNFKPEFATDAFFAQTEQKWLQNEWVEQVSYPRNLIIKIVDNVQRISWIFLAFGAVLTLIAVTLINNTIRLAIYSKRFLIKTMLLVGATAGFIRRPFIVSGFIQGLIGGIIALLLLGGTLLLAENKIMGLREIRDVNYLGVLALAIVAGGVILSLICTFFAVRKYLNLKTDSLY
ncbi:MAG: cell division protein FtsX [Bacteroidia bacterium]|jgi:cell division transport system permease protein